MIIVASRTRQRPNFGFQRLTDDQVRNIVRRSSIFFIRTDGGIIDGHVIDWRMEMRGPRSGQLGAVVIKPDDGACFFFGVLPDSHELTLVERLSRNSARRYC